MKKIIYLVVLLSQFFLTQDLQVKISESSIQNLFNSLAQARYFSYGKADLSGVVTFYNFKATGMSLDIQPNNLFTVTIYASMHAEFNPGPISFSYTAENLSLTISGSINLEAAAQGYKIRFTPLSFINPGEWFGNALNHSTSGIVASLPEISTTVNATLLPGIVSNYFTSTAPVLSTNNNEVILSLNLVQGPRYYTITNEVNQNWNLGFIDHEENNTYVRYKSPKPFEWYQGEVHRVQSPFKLIDDSNGKNLYNGWYNQLDDRQDEIAFQRIEILISAEGGIMKAKFKPANRIQLNNVLEGNSVGGTVTYDSYTSSSIDDYDFYDPTLVHSINSTVGSGLYNTYWYFQNWSDGHPTVQRGIVLNTDINLTAYHKGIQRSNNPSTYSNNGQQHFVRVKNSLLYSTYVSMDKLFVESKMPSAPWALMNSGKPISGNTVYSSTMDFINNGVNEDDKLLIFYTSKTPGNDKILNAIYFNAKTQHVLEEKSLIWINGETSVPEDLQPVAAVNGSNKFLVVFKRIEGTNSGLYFYPGTLSANSIAFADSGTDPYSLEYPWYIQGTNQYSVNPTISVSKTAANEPVYWIAWQQNSPSGSSSDIYYKQVTVHSNGSFTQYGGMMSGGSGYPWNRYPTITSIGNSARVAWQGYVGFIEDGMNKTGADEMEESRIIFKSTDWWQYWQFGYNVHKPNINRHDAENGYIFGWSQNGGQGIYFANNTTLSTISTVTGLQGYDVQISNGTDKSTMVANSYKTTQQPYFFTSSNGLSSFMKEQNLRIGSGREGIIRKGDVIFKYLVGDISRNGQEITFKAIPDTINLNSLSVINSYLETEPFTVNSNTELLYSVGFMVSDSVLGAEELNEGDEIKFTLTINDAVSGQQVALLDEVTYTKNALGNYGNIAFRATMEGMPETPVKLKLTVQSNFEHISSLARRVNVGDVVEKSSTKTIAVASPLIITEYSLSQNYPNPFNPVTEIEFALPEQSDVTLKVYDILGKEIATLASGNYSAGRYTVPFDGTSHASGVYIYKLSYGKGQSITRKMTLLK